MLLTEPVVSPAPLLEQIYRKIQLEHMQGLPVLNPALEVEAVGFIPYNGLWLGILITPWFMNLMLLPATEACPALTDKQSQTRSFPCGAVKFLGNSDESLGNFLFCTLFAPMREFNSQLEARSAAQTVMTGLFVEAIAAEPEPISITPPPVNPIVDLRTAVTAPMTKRDFLRGGFLPVIARES